MVCHHTPVIFFSPFTCMCVCSFLFHHCLFQGSKRGQRGNFLLFLYMSCSPLNLRSLPVMQISFQCVQVHQVFYQCYWQCRTLSWPLQVCSACPLYLVENCCLEKAFLHPFGDFLFFFLALNFLFPDCSAFSRFLRNGVQKIIF